MFDVRKSGPFFLLQFLLLVLVAFSIALSAQEKGDKDKEKEKESKKAPANYVKLEGKVRCEKPETAHALEVPDRPGHALMLERRKCTWTEPFEIKDAKTREGVMVGFTERMEGTLHTHAFEVDTLQSGEQLTMNASGEIYGEKGPAKGKGRWYFMRGTGKYKGIKGSGRYEAELEADDVLTLEFEGVFDPSEMVGEKK